MNKIMAHADLPAKLAQADGWKCIAECPSKNFVSRMKRLAVAAEARTWSGWLFCDSLGDRFVL
jgi:hypothetical protein